jgi:hypothetical protein
LLTKETSESSVLTNSSKNEKPGKPWKTQANVEGEVSSDSEVEEYMSTRKKKVRLVTTDEQPSYTISGCLKIPTDT